ncbi:unnamed protein product [Discula destructiva]
MAALWQWVAATMYWTLEISQGTAQLTVSLEEYFEKLKLWLRVTFLASIFFYTALTAVKLSFLLFFRRLGDRVYRFPWYWWPVLAFVLCTWIIGIGTSAKEADCTLPKNIEVLFYECQASSFTSFDTAVIKAMCVLDIVSDFLIVMIPVGLLWNVKMRLRRKLAFLGLFSLSLITVAIAIARVADISATTLGSGASGFGFNPKFLWLWTAVEPCVGESPSIDTPGAALELF